MNKTLRSTLAAAAIIGGAGALAAVGSCVYLVYHHTTATFVRAETADAEFAE